MNRTYGEFYYAMQWQGKICTLFNIVHSNPGGGGGSLHMKGMGMLVVSLRGINLGFWSHLGRSGQNAIIFSREGLV